MNKCFEEHLDCKECIAKIETFFLKYHFQSISIVSFLMGNLKRNITWF